jgi:hypothetical protein
MKNLTDKDKETISAYADSLRDSSENNADEEAPDGDMPNDGGAPMMETVIFKKSQIRRINENLLAMEPKDEKNNAAPEKMKGNGVANKSPFKSPKFN